MTSSSIMDPADVFDSDEIDNAIKIIENEIDAVKKQEIAEKQKDLPSQEAQNQEAQNQEEKNSIDSLITKALKYVDNVNSQADDIYQLFYTPLATRQDRSDASKVAIVESLRVKNENINAITNLVNAKAKLEALKEKQQQQMNGGIFVNAVPGSEVGINIANLRAAEKS